MPTSKRQPPKRTFHEWSKVKTPPPPPEPTYTEAEYEAIKERGKPPFYQLKAEIPGVVYDAASRVYIIEGHRFKRAFLDSLDLETRNTVITLAHVDHDPYTCCPVVGDYLSYLRCMEWVRAREKAKQPKQPEQSESWVQRLLSRVGF